MLDEPGGNVLLDLFVLDQRVGAMLKAALVSEGLSPAQYAVYAQINAGATTPSQIADRLSLSPATLTGYLDTLERRGHLERKRSDEDGRSVTLRLTEAGAEKCRACQAVVADVVRKLDRSLGGAAARNEIRSSLGRLNGAIDLVQPTLGR